MPLLPYNISLEKNFFVKAESDSLKRKIKIAFTVTPHEPDGPSHPYYPIASYVTSFGPNGVGYAVVQWYPRFHPRIATAYDRVLNSTGACGNADFGCTITLRPPESWSEAAPHGRGVTSQGSSSVIKNESGSMHHITLTTFTARVAYHPLESGQSIKVPSSWKIQAYLVDETITDGTILQSEDLKSPIFSTPVLWDALPTRSTWMVIQDNDGTIRLNNDEFNPVGPVANPVPTKVEPITKKDPLSELLERFALMEKSIACIQNDVASGQKNMEAIQKQLSALERSTKEGMQEMGAEFQHNIAMVEANATTLASSFDQSRDQLSEVQKVVAGTQQLLSRLEKSTHNRLSTLEEAATRTQNHVVAVEKAVHQTQDHVSVVQQLVLAKQPTRTVGAPDPVSPLQGQPIAQDGRVLAVEARVEKLEKVIQEQRKVLRAVDRRLPDMEVRTDKLELDLGAVQVSATGLGRRVSAIEARLGDGDGGTESSISSSTAGSPVMFPTHLVDGPPAT